MPINPKPETIRMRQLPLFENNLWSVTQLTQYLRGVLEEDYQLQDIRVQGEVSNFRRPSSGHVYFTLKDSACILRCVMWRTSASRQSYLPRDGEAVEVHGAISIYEADGQYQLYADTIRPVGEGFLYQEFLRIKARLDAEGLFAEERKRAIPAWPRLIGIITSPTGAALRDMLNTIRRRYPLAQVVLAPCTVQGVEAPGSITAALGILNRVAQPDVILLARGGGSIEDLWAFNDERVARAVAASSAPVISGVGHETDYTICDFVSDIRAPTPTAAAELATPNRSELAETLADLSERSIRAMQDCLVDLHWELDHLQAQLARQTPQARIRNDRQRLDDWTRRMTTHLEHQLQLQRVHLNSLEQRARALSPSAVLQRGFAIVTQEDGTIIRSINQARPGVRLKVQVADGAFNARTESGEPVQGSDHGK